MKKTFRRAVVFGLLALAAPFAALPLAKPATTDLQSTTPPPEVLPEPAATPLPAYTAAPMQRSFNAAAPILICDDGVEHFGFRAGFSLSAQPPVSCRPTGPTTRF